MWEVDETLKHHNQLVWERKSDQKGKSDDWICRGKGDVYSGKHPLKIPSCFVTTVPEVWKAHIQAKNMKSPPLHHPDQRFCLTQERGKFHAAMPRTNHFSTTFPRSTPCTSNIDKWELTGLSFFLTLQLCIPHSHYIFSNPLQKTSSDILQADRQGTPLAGWIHCQTTARRAVDDLVSPLVPSPASSPLVSLSPMKKAFQQLVLILLDELLHETLSEPMCLTHAWNPKWAARLQACSSWFSWDIYSVYRSMAIARQPYFGTAK